MDSDRDNDAGWVPLGSFSPRDHEPRAGSPGRLPPRAGRREGAARARRMSNWTAAALIVGTGAATVALARGTVAITPAAVPAAAGTVGQAGTAAGTAGTAGPSVAHSVATTSGSGVTTTTTTRVVNGKTIVTKVQHAPAYHDN